MIKKFNFMLLALGLAFSLGAFHAKACDTPSNLSATLNSGISIHFAWDAVAGADSYNFQLYHENSPETGKTNNIASNSMDLSLLYCGNYYLKVQAVCSGTPSSWASYYFATPGTCFSEPASCTSPSSFTVTYNC